MRNSILKLMHITYIGIYVTCHSDTVWITPTSQSVFTVSLVFNEPSTNYYLISWNLCTSLDSDASLGQIIASMYSYKVDGCLEFTKYELLAEKSLSYTNRLSRNKLLIQKPQKGHPSYGGSSYRKWWLTFQSPVCIWGSGHRKCSISCLCGPLAIVK